MAEQLELIRNLANAYADMNLSAISDVFHPDYVHVVHPQSINVPERNKAQYLEDFGKLFDNWAKVTPVSYSFSRWPTFFHPH